MLIPLVALVIVILGIIVALVVLKIRKERKLKEPNYRAFFFMGICFLAMGTALISINPGFMGFTGLGLVYMTIGLTNRDKWTKKKKR